MQLHKGLFLLECFLSVYKIVADVVDNGDKGEE